MPGLVSPREPEDVHPAPAAVSPVVVDEEPDRDMPPLFDVVDAIRGAPLRDSPIRVLVAQIEADDTWRKAAIAANSIHISAEAEAQAAALDYAVGLIDEAGNPISPEERAANEPRRLEALRKRLDDWENGRMSLLSETDSDDAVSPRALGLPEGASESEGPTANVAVAHVGNRRAAINDYEKSTMT